MKKLIAIMLFIFPASLIYSQTTNNQPTQPTGNKGSFKGGIMVNPFLAWPMGNVDDPTKNKVDNGTTQFGLGVEYNLGGTTNLVAGITWSNGFTNVWNKQPDVNGNSTTPPVWSNFNSPVGNISLNIGVLF